MKILPLVTAVFCGLFLTGGVGRTQTNLESIGHINDDPRGAFDVAVSGDYVFLANGGDGLRVYDISSPTNPICVGHTNNTGRGANTRGIALCGDYAYVANGNDGMRIYDVSNPTQPVNVGHSPQIAGSANAFGIAVSGIHKIAKSESIWSKLFGKSKTGAQYAYLANYDDGLRIFDVSNPTNPKRVSHLNDGGAAHYPTISGKYVYLANDNDGLRIYDVSNPAIPTNVAHVKDTGYPWGVVIAGKYAYIANNFNGLAIYDVSDPLHPVGIAHINNSPPYEEFNGHNNDHLHYDGSAYGIAVSGTHAYLANFGDGVRVYDISSPTNPVNIAHTATNYLGFSQRIAVSRGFAFVANANDGLRIYKVFDDNPPSSKSVVFALWVIALAFILLVVAIAIWRFKFSSAKYKVGNS